MCNFCMKQMQMLTLYQLSGPIRKNVIVNKLTVYLYADIFKKKLIILTRIYILSIHMYMYKLKFLLAIVF